MDRILTDRQFEIIEAAGRILTASGVHGLTIKNLAKEMDFSEAAIYRHFKGKEAIILAMLKYLADDMDARFSSISEKLTIENQFRAIFENQYSFFKKNPHFVVAVFSDGLMEDKGRINTHIFNIMKVKLKHLMPIISKGQKDGFFTDKIDKEELVHIVMGAFRLQMFKWRISNFEADIEKRGDKLLDCLMIMIKK